MAINNNAELGFEKKIWDAACILRGNMDAAEYKHVILGLIFLKYISDSFEMKYNKLLNEGEGFQEERDAYLAENIFFVPAAARWSVIAKNAHTPEIGKVIDAAMDAIEQENKILKGVLPKTYARPEMDKRRLGDVVDLFTNIAIAANGSKMDLLGRAYEYCLGRFARAGRKAGGRILYPCMCRTYLGRDHQAV